MNKSLVKFASVKFDAIDPDKTLPAKFSRLLDETPIKKMVAGKTAVIKMHLGANLGYTTIPPLFTRILINKIKEFGGDVFITDLLSPCSRDFGVRNAKNRGYSEDILGAPVYPATGAFD